MNQWAVDHSALLDRIKESGSESVTQMTTDHTLRMIRDDQQIKDDIAHLTKPLWRTAIIVACLIVVSGVFWRTVHVTLKFNSNNESTTATPR